jgi:hypothetical protein
VLLLIGFTLFLAIRFTITNNQNVYGRIKVVSSPAATVFINNVAMGKMPFEDQIKAGEYLIKLIPEENATSTASWMHKIKVQSNTMTVVNVELGSKDISTGADVFDVVKMNGVIPHDKGQMAVETEPSGAIVYLDNDEKGVAPLVLSDIGKGDHELSIFMPGFFRRTQKVNISAGYQVNAYVKLAVDPNQSPTFNLDENSSSSSSAAAGSSSSADTSGKPQIEIIDTPTGWLRVRDEASIEASESGRVNPGDKFAVLEEIGNWYKIQFDGSKTGWISKEYTRPVQ